MDPTHNKSWGSYLSPTKWVIGNRAANAIKLNGILCLLRSYMCLYFITAWALPIGSDVMSSEGRELYEIFTHALVRDSSWKKYISLRKLCVNKITVLFDRGWQESTISINDIAVLREICYVNRWCACVRSLNRRASTFTLRLSLFAFRPIYIPCKQK